MHVLSARKGDHQVRANQIRIVSDGTTHGTSVETHNGEKISCSKITIHAEAGYTNAVATIISAMPVIEMVADCTNIEDLAKDLHEAGRAAVEAGNTVAATKFGEQTRKFLEWDEISEEAREGRRIQAVWFMNNYHMRKRMKP